MRPGALLLAVVGLAGGACSNTSAPPASKAAAPGPSTSATAAVEQPAAVPAARGTVATRKFKSDALGVDKSYVVYLPAGYDTKPTARWPVFYYLHGLTGSEVNWSEGGDLDETADRLALQAIVVMPDGDDGFYVDGVAPVDYDACMKDGTGLFLPGRQSKRTTCVRKRSYSTYITSDLINHVDATYRTIATREGRGIAGLSMGGFGALQLSMRHPKLFAAAVSHSGLDSLLYNGPHPYRRDKVELITEARQWGGPFIEIKRWMVGIFGEDLARWRAHDPAVLVDTVVPGSLAIYLDCGTEDMFFFQNHTAYLHDLLLERKIEHEFFIGPGGHDFGFWKVRVAESLRFLRDNTAKPQ